MERVNAENPNRFFSVRPCRINLTAMIQNPVPQIWILTLCFLLKGKQKTYRNKQHTSCSQFWGCSKWNTGWVQSIRARLYTLTHVTSDTTKKLITCANWLWKKTKRKFLGKLLWNMGAADLSSSALLFRHSRSTTERATPPRRTRHAPLPGHSSCPFAYGRVLCRRSVVSWLRLPTGRGAVSACVLGPRGYYSR